MQVLKGYIIIDELNKVVVGYVKDDEKIKYISYNKTESCSVKIIKKKENLIQKLTTLNNMSNKMGDGHTFTYVEVY